MRPGARAGRAPSTRPRRTPRTSTRCGRRSASTRSRSGGRRTGRRSSSRTPLAHPDHVERLLLDSVVTPTGPDPLGLDTLQGIPLGLSAMCGNAACRAIAPEPGRGGRRAREPGCGHADPRPRSDASGPLEARVAGRADPARGRRQRRPQSRPAGGATVGVSARDGRPPAGAAPPRRASARRLPLHFAPADASFSEGLFLATTCNDGRFPWAAERRPRRRASRR